MPVGDRLILLNNPASATGPPYEVVYDSQGDLATGSQVPMDGLVANEVAPRTVSIGGHNYLVADVHVGGNHFVKWLLLATPAGAAQASATQQLVPRILVSAGAALLLAILVTLLLARAFTRPLNELKAAAEDIAAGNYGRRVNTTTYDEVAVVGLSFNRMAEAVERSRRLQREFLANASHELKTPLTSLIGFSQALMDGSLQTEDEKRRAATILHEESQRVLRMSQELLDLARVESGQLRIESQPVDLGALLQQEIDIVRQRGAARGLTLRLAVQSWLPPVHADPERLHQILENLLDNAVKYAPEGTEVWLSAEHLAGGRVRTTVRNRVGAHPPNPDRMFDRFYRADPSRASGARSGVGLGLAISRELAVAQKGSLDAELDQHGQISLKLDLPAGAPPPGAGGEETLSRPVRLPPGLPEARPT
ncbi:MAG: HAMP domain-containing histidine kinase [Candidatus Dormibacteraeota bacterium]|nr:HAMP domain-containing histidine kinase [Candidatus Dormibacteraeota bacterium]